MAPWTVARQSPLSVDTRTKAFSKPALPPSPALAGDPEAGRGRVPGACTSQGRVLGGLRVTDEIYGRYHTLKFPPTLTHQELRGILQVSRASLIAQSVKNLPAMQETKVRSLGWEDPLEKGMATHSSILA